MTSRITAHDTYHVPRGVPQYKGDSPWGIDQALDRGKDRIDFNVLLDGFGVPQVTHYPRPLMHGFHDPAGELRPRTDISAMTTAQVHRLETRDGYRISTARSLFQRAITEGLIVEADLKARLSYEQIRDLDADISDPDMIWFKTMASLPPRAAYRLRPAHRAGHAKTVILTHERGMELPRKSRLWISNFRGYTPRWV